MPYIVFCNNGIFQIQSYVVIKMILFLQESEMGNQNKLLYDDIDGTIISPYLSLGYELNFLISTKDTRTIFFFSCYSI